MLSFLFSLSDVIWIGDVRNELGDVCCGTESLYFLHPVL